MKRLSLLLLLLFGMTLSTFAQQNPVHWTFSQEKVKKGEYKITLHAKIDAHWAIYSQHLESDEGPIATSVKFAENDLVEYIGGLEEQGDKLDVYDEMFGMNISKFKKEVKFVQTVKASGKTTVKGSLEFMSCNDETCLPPREVEFEVELK